MKSPLSLTGDDIASAKQMLRAEMHRRRDALSRDAAHLASLAAAANFAALPEVGEAALIGLYAAIGSELGTGELAHALSARGLALAYPRIVPRQRPLAFHRIGSQTELVPGPLCIPQPSPEAEPVALEHLDAIVVPGLAFDRRGRRLGWGKGYYDATLASSQRPLCIGYAYAFQVVDEVPSDDRDVAMDLLITDAGVVRASDRAQRPAS